MPGQHRHEYANALPATALAPALPGQQKASCPASARQAAAAPALCPVSGPLARYDHQVHTRAQPIVQPELGRPVASEASAATAVV
ncbi:hypothetical protein [Streptomyces sp. NPDC056296]|uniref:hypothetical protein n=1 Tax=Streptomyces sp. NPDC056296 TaxID=3345775 RepID=UPI0035E20FC6